VRVEPLDELYFTWLYGQVEAVEVPDPSRTYWGILRQLYSKEFFYIIPNDDNRAEDGKALRRRFLDTHKLDHVDEEQVDLWLELGCSMLELLIALADRFAFEINGRLESCFWELMENLGLEDYNDLCDIPEEEVDNILRDVIWRTYKRTGRGGLFPLRRAEEDQRDVELWYQLNAYILENDR
jgi:hypothetical protein